MFFENFPLVNRLDKNNKFMTDVHSKKVRSYNMSRIKGKDTKPEMIVRKFLFENGFRYRLHVKNLPEKPDIVLPKYKTVIFVLAKGYLNTNWSRINHQIMLRAWWK